MGPPLPKTSAISSAPSSTTPSTPGTESANTSVNNNSNSTPSTPNPGPRRSTRSSSVSSTSSAGQTNSNPAKLTLPGDFGADITVEECRNIMTRITDHVKLFMADYERFVKKPVNPKKPGIPAEADETGITDQILYLLRSLSGSRIRNVSNHSVMSCSHLSLARPTLFVEKRTIGDMTKSGGSRPQVVKSSLCCYKPRSLNWRYSTSCLCHRSTSQKGSSNILFLR